MPTRIGSIAPAMFAALLLASAVPLLPSHAARAAAADDCLAAPKSQAPQGRHWYYRIDRVNGRKCWYLGAAGTKTRQAAPQEAQAAPHVQKPVRPLPPLGRDTAGDVLPPAQIEPSSKETAPASIAEATPQGAASPDRRLTNSRCACHASLRPSPAGFRPHPAAWARGAGAQPGGGLGSLEPDFGGAGLPQPAPQADRHTASRRA